MQSGRAPSFLMSPLPASSPQGRPLPVAVAFFLGSFLISPTLGYTLTFVVGCCGAVKLYGLWLGLIGGYSVTTIISLWAVMTSNWQSISKRAQERSEAVPTLPQPTDTASCPDQPPAPEAASGAMPSQARVHDMQERLLPVTTSRGDAEHWPSAD